MYSESLPRPCWIAFVFLAIYPVRGAGQPPLEEIIREYQSQIEPLKRSTVRVSTAAFQDEAKLPPGEPVAARTVLVHRDGDSWKVAESGTFQHNEDPKNPHRSKTKSQYTFIDGMFVKATLDPDTNAVEAVSANRPPTAKAALFQSLLQFHGTYFFVGVLTLDKLSSLAEVLRSSKVVTQFEQVQGRQLVRADVTGLWGQFTVWFDPAVGYQVRRVKQNKRDGDLVADGTTLRESWSYRDSYYAGADASINVEEFQAIDGKYFPTRFIVEDQWRIAGKQSWRHKLRTVVTVEEIKLNPSFPRKTFSLDDVIPDGTQLTVQDDRTIAHEWRDGEIQKVVNRSTLERLAGNPFRRGSWLSRGLLLLAAICFVVVGCRFVRQYRLRAKA